MQERDEKTQEGDSAALKEKARLTPAQTRILGVIAEKTVTDGGAMYSKKELADAARCDVKTVDRAITRLRREGYVEVIERFSETGCQLANCYRIKR